MFILQARIFLNLDGPVFVCISHNVTRRVRVNLQVNLMLPEVSSLPSKKDGDELNRALFTANAKMIELINDHYSFEKEEQAAQAVDLKKFIIGKYENRRLA